MRQVSVILTDEQYDWVRDHELNFSGWVRTQLDRYITAITAIEK